MRALHYAKQIEAELVTAGDTITLPADVARLVVEDLRAGVEAAEKLERYESAVDRLDESMAHARRRAGSEEWACQHDEDTHG